MSVYEKMTAIADAIRAHTGGTEPLGLDAMAEAIAGLGGGPDSVEAIDGGVITLASNQNADYELAHNLGVTPDAFFLREISTSDGSAPSSGLAYYFIIYKRNTGDYPSGELRDGKYGSTGSGGSSTSALIQTSTINDHFDNLEITIEYSAARRMIAGKKYAWIAVKFKR